MCNKAKLSTHVSANNVPSSKFLLWHFRLGHTSVKVVRSILDICNISQSNKIKNDICSACCLRKTHKLPFLISTVAYTKPLELTHSDLRVPSSTLSC